MTSAHHDYHNKFWQHNTRAVPYYVFILICRLCSLDLPLRFTIKIHSEKHDVVIVLQNTGP